MSSVSSKWLKLGGTSRGRDVSLRSWNVAGSGKESWESASLLPELLFSLFLPTGLYSLAVKASKSIYGISRHVRGFGMQNHHQKTALVRFYDIRAQRRPVTSFDFGETPVKAVSEDLDGQTIYVGNGYGDLAAFDLPKLVAELVAELRRKKPELIKESVASCGNVYGDLASSTGLGATGSHRRYVLAKDFLSQELLQRLFYLDEYHYLIGRRGRPGSLVFNPFTKETLQLPYAPNWKPYGRSRHVLGFDPSTGTFKLLDLFFEDADNKKVRAAAFNFKTQSWGICKAFRRLSHPVSPSNIEKVHATDTGNVYLWTGINCLYNPDVGSPIRKPLGQVILAFNMAREEFQSAWFPMRVHSMEIIEFGGKLAVCTAGEKYISTDVLVDYKTQEWTRTYRIRKPPYQLWFNFCTLSEKKIVVTYLRGGGGRVFERKEFYLLDLENGEQTYLGQGRFARSIPVFGVRPNLISLV
ncbi:hypothetical protein MLD38_038870 [Melastoma candidum]|uniref:Uncharacterized protein n=1 Tax=Melastoma candidum TaxID=119954 RepID=A0ACB9L0Z0_9MYRT|nr:hypothetical protein MLD38_038870 [Melastoma candidum]